MFWGGPQDHFGMLAGFQKAVIFICICCLGVARWNYFSNMWDRQISMRLTRGATYVVGGRVGMDETHQVNIHFNWDNLSLYTYSLSLRAECARLRVSFLPFTTMQGCRCRPIVNGYLCKAKLLAKSRLAQVAWSSLLAQSGWIGPIGPPRKIVNNCWFVFCIFPANGNIFPEMTPNGARRILSY